MRPSGPPDARLMIVGEAPGEAEERLGAPFVGPSGFELDKMLHEAGIARSQCFVTNVCNLRPPDNDMGEWLVDLVHAPKPENPKYKNKKWVSWKGKWAHPAVPDGFAELEKHIELVRPAVVLALGNTALFALTGRWGIKSWRGSQLTGTVGSHTFKVIPAYHPAAVLRDWSTRPATVVDFKRAARELKTPLPYVVPKYDRVIRPTFPKVVSWLSTLRAKLNAGRVLASTDIETRAGHIACVGFHIRGLPSLCIPLMCVERTEGYWTEAEERFIWAELRELMSHDNFWALGQNFAYDFQYFYRWFLIKVKVAWDTMITQHCIFPGMPKGLDYLSSLYCDYHCYWKDDIRDWDPKMFQAEDQYWNYNCEDCERTYEIYEKQRPIIEASPRLSGVWNFQTNTLAPLLLKAMCRGIRANIGDKARLSRELDSEIKVREKWLHTAAGHELKFRSPAQLKKFFYEDLQERPVWNRKAKPPTVTTNDEALETIGKRNPLLRDLCRTIQELRSIGVFKSTFVEARLDRDQRIRCSFNIGGTITFRLSSSENAFGSGLNLQNIPSGNEDGEGLELPNIRKLFVPDEGMEMFDIDLKNADFYTMVWEADDEIFRMALEAGVDTHLLNAGMIFQIKEITLDRLKDPEFEAYAKKKYGKQRKGAKPWCHGTNYGGKERTMAAAAGITVAESARFAKIYFGEHPGIKKWHERVEEQLRRFRFVENKFGYRWTVFDRVDGALPEALAWVPQSTTGCVINRAWARIDQEMKEAEVLIQVHDSLVGQFPRAARDSVLTRLPEVAKVVVPYEKPLIIPVGLKTSPISWGHCE